MAVGYPQGKSDLDERLGFLAVSLRDLFASIDVTNDLVDTLTDTQLTDRGYTTTEVTLIRGAMNDLAGLASVYRGEITVDPARDFRARVRRLEGVL